MRSDDHFSVVCDVSNAESVDKCFQQIQEKYNRAPDLIVHCAGIAIPKYALDTTEKEFYKIIDVNLKGTFLISKVMSSF